MGSISGITMKTILKQACEEDCPDILRIQQKSFAHLLEKYQDYDTNPGAESLEKILGRFIQPFTTYYFILLEGAVIGMLRVCDFQDRCRLSPICILPEYWGRGYAQQAMREMENLYPDAKIWELETIAQEEKLCHLYEKMGYLPTGKQKRLKDGMDIKFYEKKRL